MFTIRTDSHRHRLKEGPQVVHYKFKLYYKVIQIPISAILNFLLVTFIGEDFLIGMMPTGSKIPFEMILILGIFFLTLISVLSSNFIAMTFIVFNYKGIKLGKFLSKSGSIKRFMMVALTYSFLMSIIFSFGVFNLLYRIFGDGSILSYILIYIGLYILVEFFSYGIISFLYDQVGYRNRLK